MVLVCLALCQTLGKFTASSAVWNHKEVGQSSQVQMVQYSVVCSSTVYSIIYSYYDAITAVTAVVVLLECCWRDFLQIKKNNSQNIHADLWWHLWGASLDKDTGACRRDALRHYLITADIAPAVPPSHFDSQVHSDSPQYQAGAGKHTCVHPTKMTLETTKLKLKNTFSKKQRLNWQKMEMTDFHIHCISSYYSCENHECLLLLWMTATAKGLLYIVREVTNQKGKER